MIFIAMSRHHTKQSPFRKPIISINSERISDADDDSDYDDDVVSNSDSEKISKGYERLCNDVETVMIHNYDSDNNKSDANYNNNNHSDSDENLNNFSKLNNEKIILNLSHDKIFGTSKEFKINNLLCEPVQVKKSHSANFPSYEYATASQHGLQSPSLIKNLKESNTYLTVSPVIYDVPQRRVSVAALPLRTHQSTSSSQCNMNRIEKYPINLNSPTNRFIPCYVNDFSTSSPSSSLQTVIAQINTLPVPETPIFTTLKPMDHIMPSTSAMSMASHTSNKSSNGISKFLEDKFKCSICHNPYKDPKVLDCLHSFCYHCLEEIESEHYAHDLWQSKLTGDGSEIEWNFNSKPENSCSGSVSGTSTHDTGNNEYLNSRSSLANVRIFGRRHRLSSPKLSLRGRNSSTISFLNKPKFITCPKCNTTTEIPVNGLTRLPSNFILARHTETVLNKMGTDAIPFENCKLCATDTKVGYYCTNCKFYLCEFCQEAHVRQNSTANHEIRPLNEIKPTEKTSVLAKKRVLKCPIHRTNDLKLFCSLCIQIVCSDCTILLHRGHKCDPINKASKVYIKMIKNSLEKTRPLTDYANHTISKLTGLSNRINVKCDQVEKDVNTFLAQYFEALAIHQSTLLQQIIRAKENKMDVIKTKKEDLVKRSEEAKVAIKFAEDLLFDGNEAEILTFVGLLQKRFDHCQKSDKNFDFKITESLQFLPEIRAPSSERGHIKIPIYGIITTQTAVSKYCTLETKELMNLRVHRKAELVIMAKDNSERPLCHGGLSIIAELRYNKDTSGRLIPIRITDKRDGTYILTFTPDTSGLMKLAVFIQNKPIKGSPFTLCARSLRPHCGIYHCCTFCSSGGLKTVSCACGGVMDGGYKGCGHGHDGHPGRRHWSCCANILENSECSKANVITYPTQ